MRKQGFSRSNAYRSGTTFSVLMKFSREDARFAGSKVFSKNRNYHPHAASTLTHRFLRLPTTAVNILG
jgi:hypothetical protein